MTTGTETPTRPERPRRALRWWHGPVRVTLGIVIIVVLCAFGLLGLTGRTLPAPHSVVARIEARANAALAGQAVVRVGGAEALVDDNWAPRIRLINVQLFTPQGAKLADLPDVRSDLSGRALIRGQLLARSLTITGARAALNRRSDGSFSFAPESAVAVGGSGAAASGESVGQALEELEKAFALPALASLRRIDVTGMGIRFADARTKQVWTVEDGTLALEQNDEAISITLGFALATDAARVPAEAKLDFVTYKTSREARIVADFQNFSARDLAAQSPPLAWLGVLDAPISGTLRTGVEPAGGLAELSATLDIGRGALQPTPETAGVTFDQAGLALDYDPSKAELVFRDITLDSAALRVRADAKAWLQGMEAAVPGDLPRALVAQVAISDLKADPAGLFENPVRFSQGAIDLKLELDPFRLTVGQLVLIEQGRRISARGRFSALPKGWDVALDVGIDAIESARLLALWPVRAVPKTRLWLQDNVATAELFDLKAALRLTPGTDPRLSLGYEFRDADVRFIRSLPPIRQGAGYATISDNSYTLVLDQGQVTPPLGGDLDMAGSVLRVPDIRIVPAPAEVKLAARSSITAALSLLDQPPFRFLTKAGRPVEIADGRADVTAKLKLVLAKAVAPDDVNYDVTARLTDVTSSTLVPGRTLAADELSLTATKAGMRIEGPGTLDGVPFKALWRQDFGPDRKGISRVVGTAELSPRFLDAFGIALPAGSVKGEGSGDITLDIRPGEPVAFTLTSDLKGVALTIPGLAWSKPRGTAGKLDISGTLGKPPRVDRIALKAPGLTASGSIGLRADGSLDAARFDTVSLGWFEGGITLAGQGRGRTPALSIDGGKADLRRAAFAKSSGSGSLPISVALDRLTISDGIALRDLRGDFSTGGGFNGSFTGAVNGDAAVSGTVAPLKKGTGVRIRSKDAGAVMRAAGIFTRGRGGALDMTLRPTGASGTYDGDLSIKNIRVVDAPVLAELLGAISVIGLLEQLNGSGILFGDVTGRFLLTPDAVEIRNGSAIGASLGVSGEGVYLSSTKEVDLRGTVSPLYILNGIGTIFSRQREGLFGFNYQMKGQADDPRVTVNPLSILTPGMFREIFRSAPPKLPASPPADGSG